MEPSRTYFDTPERTAPSMVAETVRSVAGVPLLADLPETYPTLVMVPDENRQIVAFNRRCLPYLQAADPALTFGLRLGEAIACVHAHDMDAGCGTSMFCRDCGAAAAIRTTHGSARPASLECRITASRNGRERALDLRVHTSSIDIGGRRFTVAALEDIADQKRRQAFERIFFHDVLNTAGTISQVAHLLGSVQDPGKLRELTAILGRSASQLVEEIQAQRDLLDAERGELRVDRKPVFANTILSAIQAMYAASPVAADKTIVVDEFRPDTLVETDAVQAIRCLGNLVKNALEASAPSGEVRLYGESGESSVAFHVRNAGVLADHVRRQMFQRSFSTKGTRGRGIGSHSVKLVVEQYLGGTVSFMSDPERETIFTIRLPRAAAHAVAGPRGAAS